MAADANEGGTLSCLAQGSSESCTSPGESAYGSAASVCELSLALNRLDLDVHVLALSCVDEDAAAGFARLEAAGVSVTRLPIRTPSGWMRPQPAYRIGDIARIRKALQQLRPDLVHCHESLGLAAVHASGRGRTVPTVATIHGATGKNPLYEALFRWLCAGVDARIVLTQRDLRSSEASGDSAVLLRNAVDPAWWAAAHEAAADLRAELGIPREALVIGLVGRLSPEKGGEPFLHAYARSQALRGAQVHVLVAGAGPRERRLRALCDRLGITPTVRFTGRCRDMPRVYRTVDLVALPSRRETQPMVLLEALACGVPVVATAAGEVPVMLANGAGTVFPIGGLHEMISGIESLIASKEQRDTLSRRGRSRVESAYSVVDLARDIVERVYEPLLP